MTSPLQSVARGALRPYAELPARPWFLAPPRRLAVDPSAEILTLHTIQTAQAYTELVETGRLVGEPHRGDPDFQDSYSWMLKQMAERNVPGPRDAMLWLYAATTGRELRVNARRARGEVMLSVRVPRRRVLISDLADWHAVLNQYLHVPLLPGESEEAWEKRWVALDDDFTARTEHCSSRPLAQWPEALRSELETSWEAIFDPATWVEGRTLQATLRELRAEDVLRAVRIR